MIDATAESWVQMLQAAYEAGYYKTESDLSWQSTFPWQNKTCKDCPFWVNSTCQVFAEYRSSIAHTCSYFDPNNHAAAQDVIHGRLWQSFDRWWQWFNSHGAAC